MFKDLFSNRLFIGALAFFVLCVVSSLLYLRHVEQTAAVKLAETEARVKHVNIIAVIRKAKAGPSALALSRRFMDEDNNNVSLINT